MSASLQSIGIELNAIIGIENKDGTHLWSQIQDMQLSYSEIRALISDIVIQGH